MRWRTKRRCPGSRPPHGVPLVRPSPGPGRCYSWLDGLCFYARRHLVLNRTAAPAVSYGRW